MVYLRARMSIRLTGGKKELVFCTTLELINQLGFHGTSMSMIAKNSGVAIGTIYHYFESKDALIQELFIHTRHRLAEAIKVNDEEAKSYKERFLNHWVNHFRFYVEHPACLCFLEQYINSPYAGDEEKIRNEFNPRVKPLIQQGIEAGAIRNINHEILIPILHGSIASAAKLHLSGRNIYQDSSVMKIAEVVWDGIKKQE